jgi:hypothetical protein
MTYILHRPLARRAVQHPHRRHHWAEVHGCDEYRMIELDDPAEAPAKVHRMQQEQPPTARLFF